MSCCCKCCEKNNRLNLTEAYFPLSLWKRLRTGMTIRYRKSGNQTEIISARNNCIVVSSGSTYVPSDRYMFLPIIELEAK